MPAVRLVHRIRQHLPGPVDACELTLRLHPIGATHHQVAISPIPLRQTSTADRWGNDVLHASLAGELRMIEVKASSTAIPGRHLPARPALTTEALLAPSARVPHLAGTPSLSADEKGLRTLRAHLAEIFTYAPGSTDVDTPLTEFVALRRGVCQDFAHYALSCLRSSGIAAAYVGGYDSRATTLGHGHAWVALRRAGGWLPFDPTTGTVAPEHTIAVAVGRDYDDVAPVAGSLDLSGAVRLESEVFIDST